LKGSISWLESSLILEDVIYNKKNLEKLVFVNKNWPNNCRVGCKSLSNLLGLIGIDAHLEDELEQFERAFERDEIVDL
jgi:hypothetical protein